jgi:hypothetical protein
MRRLALAITLGCVLSGMVRAGEIPTTGAIASPTPSPATAPGEIHPTGVVATTPGEIHTTGEAALTIILTLISIVP